MVQLDKSTYQSYNCASGVFGFNGRPSQRTIDLLNEIGEDYGVIIKAVVQHVVSKLIPAMPCFTLVRSENCEVILHQDAEHILKETLIAWFKKSQRVG